MRTGRCCHRRPTIALDQNLGGAKLHPTGTVNITLHSKKDRSAGRSKYRVFGTTQVQGPSAESPTLAFPANSSRGGGAPLCSTEFAHDYSHLSVIFSGAKAGTKLSDSFIGVGRHNITSISAIVLGRLLAGHIVQGLRTATRKVFSTLLSALGKDNTADTVLYKDINASDTAHTFWLSRARSTQTCPICNHLTRPLLRGGSRKIEQCVGLLGLGDQFLGWPVVILGSWKRKEPGPTPLSAYTSRLGGWNRIKNKPGIE